MVVAVVAGSEEKELYLSIHAFLAALAVVAVVAVVAVTCQLIIRDSGKIEIWNQFWFANKLHASIQFHTGR